MQTLLWKESPHIVAGVCAAAAMLIALGILTGRVWFCVFVAVLFTALMLLLVWFYRMPEPAFDKPDSKKLLAPADGIVKDVSFDAASGMFKVIIYLNIFNQHQQFYPVSGTVYDTVYTKGTFAPAYMLEKTEHNERQTTTLRTPDGHTVVVRQIAGQWARRIVNDAVVGDTVLQGQRMGMIKLSSRVDVIFHAKHYAPAVKVGDKVVALETVMAYLI
jgi:phosphatidylserine decarboxylase